MWSMRRCHIDTRWSWSSSRRPPFRFSAEDYTRLPARTPLGRTILSLLGGFLGGAPSPLLHGMLCSPLGGLPTPPLALCAFLVVSPHIGLEFISMSEPICLQAGTFLLTMRLTPCFALGSSLWRSIDSAEIGA